MFIIDMIIMSITANLGLIAFTLIATTTVLLARFGEQWGEALIERHPWIMEDTDKNLFELIRDRKK